MFNTTNPTCFYIHLRTCSNTKYKTKYNPDTKYNCANTYSKNMLTHVQMLTKKYDLYLLTNVKKKKITIDTTFNTVPTMIEGNQRVSTDRVQKSKSAILSIERGNPTN